jgi:tetratricopeptide (TPR) repeat protein
MAEKQIDALLAARPAFDKTIYMTVGDEGAEFVATHRSFAEMMKRRRPANVRWMFEEMVQEDHGSIVHRAIYRGLEQVFDRWNAPQTIDSLAQLEAHYARLGERFKITVRVPENVLNLYGYQLLGAGRVDDAIAAFRRNVELYPDSANPHDSLGEALEAKGERAAAIECYERAVKVAAANRDRQLDVFQKRLEEARARGKK